jgi:Uma2 family endonuclease
MAKSLILFPSPLSMPPLRATLLKYAHDYYKSNHPGPKNILLLVEIADASLDYDQEEKLPAYGHTGIPEVCIVNLKELAIEVYRKPHFTGYGSKTVLRAGNQANPLTFPDAVIDVAELLKR